MSARKWERVEWHAPKASPKRDGKPVARIHATYDSGNDWNYPIVLNGRTMLTLNLELPEGHPQVRVSVNGERHVPPPKVDYDDCEVD